MGGTSTRDIGAAGRAVNPAEREAAIPLAASSEDYGELGDLDLRQLREDLGDLLDIEVSGEDGAAWTPAQVLDELEGDLQAQRVLDACMLGRS
jgi:hypothetical protein